MRKNKVSNLNIPWVLILFLMICLLYSCTPDQGTENDVESSTPLIPEDQVRLSNDLEKTEVFRDAGVGLFIH